MPVRRLLDRPHALTCSDACAGKSGRRRRALRWPGPATLPAWLAASERKRPHERHHPDISRRRQAALRKRASPAASSPRASPSRSPRGPWPCRSTAGSPTLPTRSTADASVKIVTRTDPEALELIRHDAAHVMAEAVQALWPGTQVTIGPVIENGFFYDFAKAGAVPPRRPREDRGEDARDHRAQRALHQGALEPRARPRPSSGRRASCSRSSWSTPFPRARTSRSTSRASGSTSAAART